jgi:hypothetical protein
MYQMTDEQRVERARVKALHNAIREDRSHGDRYRNLAWGYIRGFKYRRIERSHHMQALDGAYWSTVGTVSIRKVGDVWHFEHNMPYPDYLFKLLQKHLPDLKKEQIVSWLQDPSGAISAPPPRPKAPYPREAAMVAATV